MYLAQKGGETHARSEGESEEDPEAQVISSPSSIEGGATLRPRL
jgi:hypothetical protein